MTYEVTYTGRFPQNLKEIENYIGTNTTRNVAGFISHLETEMLRYKADLMAADEQIAQLEAVVTASKEKNDVLRQILRLEGYSHKSIDNYLQTWARNLQGSRR